MLDALKVILEIQELDMKMIQLMLLKRQRQKELENIRENKTSLRENITNKEMDILEIKRSVRTIEGEHQEILAKVKKLEGQQSSIKKVDEYNALTHELSVCDRERVAKEQVLSDLYDRLAGEETSLKDLHKNLEEIISESRIVEKEIVESIVQINDEGRELKVQRDKFVNQADPEVFRVYERLLCNKKDRVVVPLENRSCSGCHITLTPQHENLVRKGERIVFCEHCSRIHYSQESKALEDTPVVTKQRRRRTTTKA